MDAENLETMTCVICGKHTKLVKGTVAPEAYSKFRCPSCATSTLENNVETASHKGRKLLID